MYKAILFDLDDTILSFKKSEEYAIEKVFEKDDKIVIKGTNFTPSSVVYADNRAVDTTFADSETLFIPVSDYSQILVAQRCANFVVLGSTEPYDL